MPLKAGTSRKTISANIREFSGGKTYEHTKKKYGAAKARKQAIAVALGQARKSRKGY